MRHILCSLAAMFFMTGSYAVDKLIVTSVSEDPFNFDYQTQYLSLNASALNAPKPNSPTWWDRLWGKKTKFGLVYVEREKNNTTTKIPLFSYSAKADGNYEVDAIGVLNDAISYPIIRNMAYSPSMSDDIRIAVHYWEDPKQADVIKQIIGAAQLLGGMNAAAVDKALSISTTAVNLIEQLWPSNDQKSTISLSLIPENLRKKKISFGYADGGQALPILTVELTSRQGYFIGTTLGAALNEFQDTQIAVWRSSITEVDNSIATAGIAPVINQLTGFSNYLSTLPLNYADKVLFLADVIDAWAANSVQGVAGPNGTQIQFTMANYRKLPNADWELLSRQPNAALQAVVGNNCTTGQCKKLSNFISQASAGFDVKRYLAPRVALIVGGVPTTVDRESFASNVTVSNDAAWASLRPASGADNRWIARFSTGALKLGVLGKKYQNNQVAITVLKVDDEYYIDSIEIT